VAENVALSFPAAEVALLVLRDDSAPMLDHQTSEKMKLKVPLVPIGQDTLQHLLSTE
jgi:hypothetical protein